MLNFLVKLPRGMYPEIAGATGEGSADQLQLRREGSMALPKPVRLTGHARSQLVFRGTTEPEIVEAIRTSGWQPAERGRLECRRNYPFNAEGNRHW